MAALLFGIVVFGFGSRQGRAADDYMYEVLTRANMRREPSVEGRWVMTVPDGALVAKVGTETNGYSLIEYQGTKGYVYSSCLKSLRELTEAEAAAVVPAQTVSATRNGSVIDAAMVAERPDNSADPYSMGRAILNTAGTRVEIDLPVVANANFRTTPGSAGERIRLIPTGEKVIYLDDGENGYYHVRYQGQTGYIYSKSVDNAALADGKAQTIGSMLSGSVSRPAESNRGTSNNVLLSIRRGSGETETRKVTTTATEAMAKETVQTEAMQVNRPSVTPEVSYQISVMTSLRTVPEETEEMVAMLPGGADVLVLGKQGGYTMVEFDGMVGYVLGEHVVESVDYAKLNGQAVLFTVTAYCPCRKCCGNYSPEVTGREAHTSTGTVPMAGRTIAVDPSVIPYGSRVSIEGMGTYIAEDCGGGVNKNHIDIFFNTHEEAIAFGTKRLYVTIER